MQRNGIVMFEPVGRKRRLARRRTTTIAILVAVATAGWLFGALSDVPPQPTSAFSAFTTS